MESGLDIKGKGSGLKEALSLSDRTPDEEVRSSVTVRMTAFLGELPRGATVILLILVVLGILGPSLMPHDPTEVNLTLALKPPFFQEGSEPSYFLGTDNMGRDILSRLIGGARISLIVGLVTVVISGCIGTFLALVSGYLGGWIDAIISRMVDGMLALPFLLVAVAMAAVMGAGTKNVIVILSVLYWAQYARVLRGEVLRVKESSFVSLAIVAGCGRARILRKHILPNITNTLVILATLQVGMVILAEASLSFLGLGVPPPEPSWGIMLSEGRRYIVHAWWLCVWPGLAITFTVLAANLLGDWLRVRLDPRFRQL